MSNLDNQKYVSGDSKITIKDAIINFLKMKVFVCVCVPTKYNNIYCFQPSINYNAKLAIYLQNINSIIFRRQSAQIISVQLYS